MNTKTTILALALGFAALPAFAALKKIAVPLVTVAHPPAGKLTLKPHQNISPIGLKSVIAPTLLFALMPATM